MSTINTLTGTELALPSNSGKPTPPPRRDSIPMLELNVTQQTIQKIQEVPAKASSRRPEVISTKKNLRKVTEVKGLQ